MNLHYGGRTVGVIVEMPSGLLKTVSLVSPWGFLYSPQSTARLVDAARPYNASYRIPFRSVGKEKTGRSRATVIFMSLVRSLVPFGVF